MKAGRLKRVWDLEEGRDPLIATSPHELRRDEWSLLGAIGIHLTLTLNPNPNPNPNPIGSYTVYM